MLIGLMLNVLLCISSTVESHMASYTILQSVEIRGCIVNFQASCLDNRVTAYKSGIRKFKSPNDAGIQVTLRNSDEFIKVNTNLVLIPPTPLFSALWSLPLKSC